MNPCGTESMVNRSRSKGCAPTLTTQKAPENRGLFAFNLKSQGSGAKFFQRRFRVLSGQEPLGGKIETLQIGDRSGDKREKRGAEHKGRRRGLDNKGRVKNEGRSLEQISGDSFAPQRLLHVDAVGRLRLNLQARLEDGETVDRIEEERLQDQGGKDTVIEDFLHPLGDKDLLEVPRHKEEQGDEKDLHHRMNEHLPLDPGDHEFLHLYHPFPASLSSSCPYRLSQRPP